MKHPLIFFFLFFFLLTTYGQTEPLLEKKIYFSKDSNEEAFIQSLIHEYTYLENGNLDFTLTKKVNSEGILKLWEGRFFKYNANDLLEKAVTKKYNPDVDLWITQNWTDFVYDENQCLVEEIYNRNVGGLAIKIAYERNDNCQLISRFSQIKKMTTDTFVPSVYYERIYHADEISYDENYFRYSTDHEDFLLKENRKRIFDENEKIKESYVTTFSTNSTVLSDLKSTYNYDAQSNYLLTSKYKNIGNNNSAAEWQLVLQTTYQNEYTQNNELQSVVRNQYRYIPILDSLKLIPEKNTFIEYGYSCEGLLEDYIYYYDGYEKSEGFLVKHIYSGTNECLHKTQLKMDISIAPNPSTGDEIEISSEIFQTGNTQILLTTIDGKALLQKTEHSRCETSFLNLNNLPNGVYIIHLSNDSYSGNGKIVIAK